MNPIQAKLKIYTYSLTALAGITALLYALCYLFCFESRVHYFSAATPLPAIADAILLLSLIWAATLFLFIPRGRLKTTVPAYATGSIFGVTLSGLLLLFYSTVDAIRAYQNGIRYADRRTQILVLLAIVAGFCSAIYFLTGLSKKLRTADGRLILGCFTILWAISTLAQFYFDFYHPMNEPAKVALMLAMVCIMLTTLAEVRTALGTAQPRLCLFAHFASMLVCGVAGIAGALAASRIDVMADYRSTFLIIAALFVYYLFRTYDIFRHQLAPATTDESEAAA